jgi:hypothetical protein
MYPSSLYGINETVNLIIPHRSDDVSKGRAQQAGLSNQTPDPKSSPGGIANPEGGPESGWA